MFLLIGCFAPPWFQLLTVELFMSRKVDLSSFREAPWPKLFYFAISGRLRRIVAGHQQARHGLRRLSPDLITKAIEETSAQVTRIELTFLGTGAFCLLSLSSPDSALLGDREKINVPLAGPVSFFGFMLLGPAVLIMLRVYLQIYVEHRDRLERLGRSMMAVRAPTLVPLKNPLIRVFSGLAFYVGLPMAMILFAWKAAVFPAWGSGLLCVAAGVIAGHAILPLRKVSWRSKALLSVAAAIVAGGVMFRYGAANRPFDLYHANLSTMRLEGKDLSGAILSRADLSNANLRYADLSNTNMTGTILRGSNLSFADLSDARLLEANLSDANLGGATLRGATLIRANLSNADLTVGKLRDANLLDADLHGAKLRSADLSDTFLAGVNLSNANLRFASLRNSNLINANLSGADLSDADLRGTNLGDAKGVDQACGNVNTRLPEGFTVKPCPAEPEPILRWRH